MAGYFFVAPFLHEDRYEFAQAEKAAHLTSSKELASSVEIR